MVNMVIAVYRPKPGKLPELTALMRSHVPDLRAWGFATDRPATALQAADGTILEIFEWGEGAVEKAHHDERVLAMWGQFGAVCDMISLRDVPETAHMFAHFAPLDL